MRGTEPVSRRNMVRRNFWIIAVAIPLLILAGDVVYWRIAVERLRTVYRNWISTTIDQGWEISSGVAAIGGWPWAATVAIPEFKLQHAGSALPGNLKIAAAGVTLSISMFRPANLLISMSGPVHLRVTDTPDLVLTSEEDWISVSLMGGDSRTINLHATGLRVEPAMAAWHATAGLVDAQAKVVDEVKTLRSEPAAYFSVSAEAIALPTLMKWPLGGNISSLSLDGVLNGPLPENSGCYRLGRSLARRRRVVGDQPSRVGVGAIGPNLLGNAGAGRPASANGQRQRAYRRLRGNARSLGGGGDVDEIRRDCC